MCKISNICFQEPVQQNELKNLLLTASMVIDDVFLVSDIQICTLNSKMSGAYIEWPDNFAITNSEKQAKLEQQILSKFMGIYRGFPLNEKPTLREMLKMVYRQHLSKNALRDFSV